MRRISTTADTEDTEVGTVFFPVSAVSSVVAS